MSEQATAIATDDLVEVTVIYLEFFVDENEIEVRIQQYSDDPLRIPIDLLSKDIVWAMTCGYKRYRALAPLRESDPVKFVERLSNWRRIEEGRLR